MSVLHHRPRFQPGRNHIELASGKYLDLVDPDPSVITLRDVAHGLSHLCRFAGQCDRFYSVAEHAVLVEMRLHELGYSDDVCLAGLHHDDSEAFVVDLPRALKSLLPEYKVIEARIFQAVTDALGLTGLPFDDPVVKDADEWALAQEAAQLLPSAGRGWYWSRPHSGGRESYELGVAPEEARRWFLNHHQRLTGRRAA